MGGGQVPAVPRPVRRYDVSSSPAGITISLPGADSQDAERRRQIALRALSERLNKSEAAQSQWPSMDDPENTESPSPSPTTAETKARTGQDQQKEQQEGEGEGETPEVLVEI